MFTLHQARFKAGFEARFKVHAFIVHAREARFKARLSVNTRALKAR